MACDALRCAQGICTRPAMGSQIKPMILTKANAAACIACSPLPPLISTAAADAMAAATPHSAWQPPSAPETVALRVITAPMPEETKRPRNTVSSVACK